MASDRLTEERLRSLESRFSPISHEEVLALVAEVRSHRPAPGSASPPERTLAERVADPAFAAEVRIHERYLGPLTSAQDWSRRWKAAAKRWRWEVVKPREGGCVCEDGVIRVTGRAKGLDCPFCREKRRAASAEARAEAAEEELARARFHADEFSTDGATMEEVVQRMWDAISRRIGDARRAESALSALREGVQRIRILATNGNPMDPTKAALAFGEIHDVARALLGGGEGA